MTHHLKENGNPGRECLHKPLAEELHRHALQCIECGLCVKECSFLKKYGTPKIIARQYQSAGSDGTMAFECSLCGLCGKVCPPRVGLKPGRLFLEMRREARLRGRGDFKQHRPLLGYERRGISKLFSYHGLPAGCDTVLFPGCTLAGTRPQRVMDLFQHLQKSMPTLGIVLHCCTKPSHDLGRDNEFNLMFGGLKEFLGARGIRKVLVACPSCHQVLQHYGGTITVETVYEYMALHGAPHPVKRKRYHAGEITIHDPCATRFEKEIHRAVRVLATAESLTVREMNHHGEKTLCCGEGGAVGFIAPDLAANWSISRKNEAQGRKIFTYCAGCVNYLRPHTRISHILDFLFDQEAVMDNREKVSKAPFTYLNRILLKKRFQRNLAGQVVKEGSLF